MCKVKRGHVKVVNNIAEAESEQYVDLCSITTESVNKVTKSLDRQSSQLFAAMLLGMLYRLEFMVVDAHSAVPLLGNRAVQDMKLVSVQSENILVVDNVGTKMDNGTNNK